jgi:hypothetical protein
MNRINIFDGADALGWVAVTRVAGLSISANAYFKTERLGIPYFIRDIFLVLRDRISNEAYRD